MYDRTSTTDGMYPSRKTHSIDVDKAVSILACDKKEWLANTTCIMHPISSGMQKGYPTSGTPYKRYTYDILDHQKMRL